MAQATTQLSPPCGWNSKAQPLAPTSIGPRKIPRPPRRPRTRAPLPHLVKASCQQRKRLQSILTEPQGARPAFCLFVQRLHWTTHDDNSSRLARCRQLASSFWNSLQVPPIFGRERRLPASPLQLFPRKPPPRTKQASVPRTRPQGRRTRNDDQDGHSQQHHHPRAPQGRTTWERKCLKHRASPALS